MDIILLIITALLVSIPAGILGVFLLLKKQVLIGDAISHSVLPGIVVAFLITGERQGFWIFFGAGITGVLATLIIRWLTVRLRIQSDAAIGTVFTFLFALGVLLIAQFAGNNVDLDQECVLYGDMEFSVLDTKYWDEYLIGTPSIFRLIPLNLITLLFIIICFPLLRIWSFNADYGKTRGFSVQSIEIGVMVLLSFHAVLSFESVGVVLVIGMLAIPGSTALLLSKSLEKAIILTILICGASCVGGVLLAQYFNVYTAPLIVVFAGIIFLCSFGLQQIRFQFVKKSI